MLCRSERREASPTPIVRTSSSVLRRASSSLERKLSLARAASASSDSPSHAPAPPPARAKGGSTSGYSSPISAHMSPSLLCICACSVPLALSTWLFTNSSVVSLNLSCNRFSSCRTSWATAPLRRSSLGRVVRSASATSSGEARSSSSPGRPRSVRPMRSSATCLSRLRVESSNLSCQALTDAEAACCATTAARSRTASRSARLTCSPMASRCSARLRSRDLASLVTESTFASRSSRHISACLAEASSFASRLRLASFSARIESTRPFTTPSLDWYCRTLRSRSFASAVERSRAREVRSRFCSSREMRCALTPSTRCTSSSRASLSSTDISLELGRA
mmetsp:Transcript_28593/g.64817  ORF Transcript_28593/g.64817 Transcript_28593/m.64817 type:complete len:337 (-) Transcript_28593:309-1319(-)